MFMTKEEQLLSCLGKRVIGKTYIILLFIDECVLSHITYNKNKIFVLNNRKHLIVVMDG
jgi:hypothetical protein